jgi:hypothetical protein
LDTSTPLGTSCRFWVAIENTSNFVSIQDVSLVTTIALCNCAIAIFVLAIAIWTWRFRQGAIALAEFCDRWERDSAKLLSVAPAAIDRSLDRIEQIRQLYRHQLTTIDRIQTWRLVLGVARSAIFKRGFRG